MTTIQELTAEWFRGAATAITLSTDNKSVVVYGPNGAGKTTFADGLEFVIRGGKIAHLSHEYSGRRLENAIINTHCPEGASRRFSVKLGTGEEVVAELGENGAARFSGAKAVNGWEKGWTILRQDEVSAFVHSSKGDKYSELLPLIGLDPIENVATNLRALHNRIKEQSGLERMQGQLRQLRQEWEIAFPGLDVASVGALVKDLHRKYLPEAPMPTTLADTLSALHTSVAARIEGLGAESTCHIFMMTAMQADLLGHLSHAVEASEKAAAVAAPLLEERLSVLRSAGLFGENLENDAEVVCPACGQNIAASQFKNHVTSESIRLEEALRIFHARKVACGRLASALGSALGALYRKEMDAWRFSPMQQPITSILDALYEFDMEALRNDSGAHELEKLRALIEPLVYHLQDCLKVVPPSIEEVVRDQRTVQAVGSHSFMKSLSTNIHSVECLLAFVAQTEMQVRNEVRERTESVIGSISTDMKRMWSTLHPDEAIDEVRLYQPEEGSRALDIALRFHGREQPSPRLTLSEGHRNSLGLCVFFSLAKKGGKNLPILLDDVVTSFDREHRSYVADLLMAEFPETQIILLTHDHEWFVELKKRLPGTRWRLKTLLPWSDPGTGIRWDAKPSGLGAARALLTYDAMAAANRARAIMDVELAVIAEVLSIPVPFIRGTRNDHRGALDLIQRFRSRSQKCFKKKNEQGVYEAWGDPSNMGKAAEELLVTYGNAGSHGRYLPDKEVTRLIDACEAFLMAFDCSACKTSVWHGTDAGRTHLRCDCGAIRWNLST